MIARVMTAVVALGAAPLLAAAQPAQTTIPHMSRFLEWRPDGAQALFIRAESGRWYHVTLEAPCPRLQNRSNMRFEASPSDRLDQYSAIRADGWRCQVEEISLSDGPPPHRH